MQTNSDYPATPAEANDSRTASDKAVVCKELLGLSAVTLESLAQHWERRSGGRLMRHHGSDFAQGLRTAYLQCADEVRAKLTLSPMEDPEMEWANELASMSRHERQLVAQLSCQARVIQQFRRECAEKDARRSSAEAHNQILREALSVAINTVECASTDGRGNELPWYRAAKAALNLSPNNQAQRSGWANT